MEEFEKWNSKLIDLQIKGDWNKILELESEIPENTMNDIRKRYLWAWPRLEDLTFVADMAKKHGLSEGFLSIGCGSGLLEWLIHAATGINVSGLEIDQEWWSSKYSPVAFVPLKYVTKNERLPDLNALMGNNKENNDSEDDSNSRNTPESGDFGLIFCYFNNACAFNDYVDSYTGNVIIIVGPIEGNYIYTEPLPLKPNFKHPECWNLCNQRLMENGRNIIAIYCRNI